MSSPVLVITQTKGLKFKFINVKKYLFELFPATNRYDKVILFQAEKVIGATNTDGELMFLIKWKGSDEADLVTNST